MIEVRDDNVVISRERLTPDAVYGLLLLLDPSFAKSLSEEVDIKPYSVKLAVHANFEVATVSGHWGGVIAFYENEKELYIPYVCVSVANRRIGVADLLLDSLCRYADSLGKSVSLEVLTTNVAAIRLYEKHGFRIVKNGETKFYMTRVCRP